MCVLRLYAPGPLYSVSHLCRCSFCDYIDSRDAELSQARFNWLHEHRAAFAAALGRAPSWDEMAGRKGARIVVTSEFDDIAMTERGPEMVSWLVEQQILQPREFRRHQAVEGRPCAHVSVRTVAARTPGDARPPGTAVGAGDI